MLFFTTPPPPPISLFSKVVLHHCNDMQSVIVSFQFQITGIYFQTCFLKTHYRDIHRDIHTVDHARHLLNVKQSWYVPIMSTLCTAWWESVSVSICRMVNGKIPRVGPEPCHTLKGDIEKAQQTPTHNILYLH